ncbi:hypothetical protein [Aeromicrobium tamlense]|nr:hypothetical protein [Aeromicrobium tamlense]NYI37534.1 hypothetical protein [Aeromicrobium tamlense]
MKIHHPETPKQARQWETVKNCAHGAGLCYPCAAEFAYGVQLGFTAVDPPCPNCTQVMLSWPVGKSNGWRSVRGSAHHARRWKADRLESAETALATQNRDPAPLSATLEGVAA